LLLLLQTKYNSRLFANYYRVSFFGPKLEDLDQKQFIYREPPSIRIADFTERLKHQYSSHFGRDKVVVLSNTRVRREELNPDCIYLQIIAVEPLVPENSTRLSAFEQNHNLDTFTFTTPFTKDGKTIGPIQQQWLRKTTLVTEIPFPYISKRVLVSNTNEVELSPVEAATELIEDRTRRLQAELRAPLPKTLQIILQGSLLPQVNAGPVAIMEAFLPAKLASTFTEASIQRLRDALLSFLRTTKEALALNKSLIDSQQLNFQHLLQEGFGTLCSLASSFGIPSLEEDNAQQ